MYSFATPPIKLKLRQQRGGELLIANHLDQSLWRTNQKHWAAVRSYLLHSFLQEHSAAVPFTSHITLPNYAEPKPFFLSQTSIWWTFFIQFYFTYPAPLEMLLVCVQFSLSLSLSLCFSNFRTGGPRTRNWPENQTWNQPRTQNRTTLVCAHTDTPHDMYNSKTHMKERLNIQVLNCQKPILLVILRFAAHASHVCYVVRQVSTHS
jgi:hypothetical protein